MHRDSAPLQQLRLLFGAGLGTRLGSGRQYFPIVSLPDWLDAVTFLAEHDTASGPYNICAPETPTNAEFTRALGQALHRPTFLFAPTPVLKVALGKMAPDLLGSMDIRPEALEKAGYGFADRDVDAVLARALATGPDSAAG
jgi:NAD dependent epimerase/dehydratase family enzyme